MVLLAVAKENKLDIDFVVTNPAFDLSTDYLKLNPLGRVPTFVAADGWVLTEVIAIALYCEFTLLHCLIDIRTHALIAIPLPHTRLNKATPI